MLQSGQRTSKEGHGTGPRALSREVWCLLFVKTFQVSELTCRVSLSGGHVAGSFSPHEAFAIGGTNSVRGYEEGAVGSGRSYVVASGEMSFSMVSRLSYPGRRFSR